MSMSQFFMDHTAILVVAIPLLAAFLTPLLGKLSKNAPRYFTTLALMAAAGLVGLLAWNVWSNGPITYTLGSSAHSIFRIQLFVDGFGVFMALIMSTVAIAASIYSWNHMERYSSQEKYYTLLLLVVVGSYGMVFTYDIFNLFVFFEISSISLCALVAFRTERGESFEAAFKYMLYSTIAGVFLLFAVGIFYGQYGILNMGGISGAMGAAGGASLLDKVGLGLLITVFTLKAGTVPMHMATPDAYGESPAGITALFVVGSQAGLYALFRTGFTMFGPNLNTTNIGWLLIALGVISMFVGVTMALKQRDIKRVIAYSGIAQVGYVLMAFGVGMTAMADPLTMASYGFTAFRGGMFHILNYALYESLLFLAAGAIIYRAGTRDMDKMGGLGHSMKATSMIFLLGTLAVAGIPPLAGFNSKLLIYQSVYAVNPLLAAIAMMVSVLTLAAFIKVFYAAFTGPRPAKKILPAPPSMVFGMGLLTLIVLAISAFPSLVLERLVDPAVNALVPIPAIGAAGTSAATLTQNVNTGVGTYNVLILLLALSLCVLFTLWLRSMGPAKHAKRKHVGEAYYFGNKVTASARVAGSNVYWGFMKAMDKYYKPVVAEHTGSANDYVSWLTLTGAAILIVVVFL